jgi:hypothetical protein
MLVAVQFEIHRGGNRVHRVGNCPQCHTLGTSGRARRKSPMLTVRYAIRDEQGQNPEQDFHGAHSDNPQDWKN